MSESSAQRGDGVAELRRSLKLQRRDLPATVVADHSARVARALLTIPEITQARTIGSYLAVGGELDPEPALALLTASRYLPLIGEDFSMQFKLATADVTLVPNRYGIDEPPASTTSLAARDLDVVLVPLVAFDRRGARIGMGAGYYDRHFAFRIGQAAPPLLVGLAHGLQEVDHIEQQEWDVPLDLVVTEREILDVR